MSLQKTLMTSHLVVEAGIHHHQCSKLHQRSKRTVHTGVTGGWGRRKASGSLRERKTLPEFHLGVTKKVVRDGE